MEPTLQTTDTSLTITRVFRATPEELWELWTDPEKISIWHRPGPTGFTTKAEGEAKVGGAYKIAMSMMVKPIPCTVSSKSLSHPASWSTVGSGRGHLPKIIPL